MENRITVDEIEMLFGLLIKKLRRDGLSAINFRTDEYWIVTTDEWNNFTENPVPAVGSLKEDVICLKKAIEENLVHTYSEFDRLATILRAISEIEAPTGQ